VIDYELHPEAEADLDAAALYYEDRVPGLGIALIDEVEQAIGEIREYPLAHPLWPDLPPELGIRRKLLGRFPYALPFLLLEPRGRACRCSSQSRAWLLAAPGAAVVVLPGRRHLRQQPVHHQARHQRGGGATPPSST
jgi:plasmid stabilization system protein ParE